MIQHTLAVNSETLSELSDALGSSFRADLGVEYSQLIAELGGYAKDGLDIMIKHGWLEEPPQMIEHKELAGAQK